MTVLRTNYFTLHSFFSPPHTHARTRTQTYLKQEGMARNVPHR